MARTRPKFEIEDRQSEVYTGGGGRQSLQMAAGLKPFIPKKSGAFRIEVIPFQVGPAVNKFAPGLRFSPPGKWHWNVIYRVHGGVGPDNATVVCSYQTFGKPCPICEQKTVLGRSAHKEDKDAAKALYPRERQLLLVAERDDRSGSLGPVQLWEVSTFCFKKQLDLFLESADLEDVETYARFWHPDKGLTMKVAVSEESMGGGGNFSKFAPLELKARREPLPDDIFDHGYDLYSMVRERSYADVKQLFHGVEAEEDTVDDEPIEVPTKRKPANDDDDSGYESVAGDSVPPPKKPTAEPVKATPKFEVDDLVQLERKGKIVGGRIVQVEEDREIAMVKVTGVEKPVTVDWEELTPVHTKPEPEDADDDIPPPPPTKGRKPAPPPPADDDDEIPPAAPPKATPAKKTAAAGWDDEDSEPPPPKKKAK